MHAVPLSAGHVYLVPVHPTQAHCVCASPYSQGSGDRGETGLHMGLTHFPAPARAVCPSPARTSPPPSLRESGPPLATQVGSRSCSLVIPAAGRFERRALSWASVISAHLGQPRRDVPSPSAPPEVWEDADPPHPP